jgi:hypothetical protein
MNVLIYYPNDEKKVTLRKKVAEIHAEAVVNFVQKLTCDKEQKLKLIEAIHNIDE